MIWAGWLWTVGWGTVAAGADCPLYRVAPADIHALEAEGGVPRNSLVQGVLDRRCDEGVPVDVRSIDPLYAYEAVPKHACVPQTALAPVVGVSWLVPAPWNADDLGPFPQPAGLLLDPLPAAANCDASSLVFGDRTVSVSALGPLRPIDPATLADVWAIQAHAIQRFGPLRLTDIAWTHTGRVSLPWVRWETTAELAETYAREGLDTETRQERAVQGAGPNGAYLYFAGADPIRSDIWATPDTVHALIDVLADWQAACPGVGGATSTTCVVQFGDLSWYSDRRPDPLGHRDHYAGACADIRLFRSDGSRYEAYWNRPDDRPAFAESGGYDGVLTGRFIDALVARPDVGRVLFNDPAIPSATAARGHDDHLHVCFAPQ